MKSERIVLIKRENLSSHPENPRRDLGDISDLRASIREHGIMQNLTVIPIEDSEGNYRILIGHRRFAASEGIVNELPCVVIEGISKKEQLSIMLAENMQRQDLTIIEQAKTIQLMLDLGDTISEVAKKIGYSETTVYHRAEIAKLDEEDIVKAQNTWQLSISDMIELEKVKDLEKRKEILSKSKDKRTFDWYIKDYLDELRNKSEEEKVINTLGELNIEFIAERSFYEYSKHSVLLYFYHSDLENIDEFKKNLQDELNSKSEEIGKLYCCHSYSARYFIFYQTPEDVLKRLDEEYKQEIKKQEAREYHQEEASKLYSSINSKLIFAILGKLEVDSETIERMRINIQKLLIDIASKNKGSFELYYHSWEKDEEKERILSILRDEEISLSSIQSLFLMTLLVVPKPFDRVLQTKEETNECWRRILDICFGLMGSNLLTEEESDLLDGSSIHLNDHWEEIE